MDAIYTDDYIKGFWDRFYPVFERRSDERAREFQNPGENGLTTTVAEFLKHLDDRVIGRVLDGRYKVARGKEKYPRTAVFRAVISWIIMRARSLLAFQRWLLDNPFDALEMGFDYDKRTGQVFVPSYQTLWYFATVRFDVDELEELLTVLVRENARLAKEHDIDVGERTGTDATPLKTCREDAAGVYNGHYRKRMVKVVVTEDLDTWLPLAWKVIGGNEAEGVHLVEMLTEARQRVGAGVMRATWFDGGFTSNENLAKVAVLLRLDASYKISDGWVGDVRFPRDGLGERAPREEIERLYEERWTEDWYRSNAPFEYKMRALVEAGEYEAVAMHFRNAYMARYAKDPEEVLDEYHQRSNCEGWNGHVKRHYELETGLHVVGVRAITRHVLWILVAMHVVAMVRLQHGVTGNLLSTSHIL
jgi:hypothetical protein